jgi:hypothetical protein
MIGQSNRGELKSNLAMKKFILFQKNNLLDYGFNYRYMKKYILNTQHKVFINNTYQDHCCVSNSKQLFLGDLYITKGVHFFTAVELSNCLFANRTQEFHTPFEVFRNSQKHFDVLCIFECVMSDLSWFKCFFLHMIIYLKYHFCYKKHVMILQRFCN